MDDNYSLLDAMLMLLGDTLIHLVITWYVDNVWPGEFGVPKRWYFPVTVSSQQYPQVLHGYYVMVYM